MESKVIYTNKTDLFKELDRYSDGEFFAVADSRIKNHLPQWIQFSPNVFWLSSPEEQKNLSTYESATDFFLKLGVHRSSVLFAFGGGATTDFAGFVAATLLRGIRWEAVPTTLLAMVDGSLGGKVALNTSAGKNLLGSFHHPGKIYLCAEFLNTLDETNLISGKGEVVKYGLLSEEIFSLIEKDAELVTIIDACARFKMEIVQRDFQETGDRIQLNLGHTLGHAFELSLGLPHGLAVVMGMSYLFQIMGKTEALEALTELTRHLKIPPEQYALTSYPEFDREKFFHFLQSDKKRSARNIRLVLVEKPGHYFTEELPLTELKSRIRSHEHFADR